MCIGEAEGRVDYFDSDAVEGDVIVDRRSLLPACAKCSATGLPRAFVEAQPGLEARLVTRHNLFEK